MRFSKKVASVVTAGVVVLGLGLTGCAPNFTPEETFVQKVHQQILGSEFSSDRDILELGVMICSALDGGMGRAEVVSVGSENGFTVREAGVVVDASEQFLCPTSGGNL